MYRALVCEILALRDLDWVDLADQVGDCDVRRRQFFGVAPLASNPLDFQRIALLGRPLAAGPARGRERIVIYLAAP